MTITNNKSLRQGVAVGLDFAEADPITVAAEVPTGTIPEAATDPVHALNAHWALTGEVENPNDGEATTQSGYDLDEEDGLVYSGPTGAVVRMVAQLTTEPGIIAPEATDTVTLALFDENTPVAHCDEGFLSELDAGEPVWNIDTDVSLTEGHVYRLAWVGGGEEAEVDMQFAEGGVWTVYG